MENSWAEKTLAGTKNRTRDFLTKSWNNLVVENWLWVAVASPRWLSTKIKLLLFSFPGGVDPLQEALPADAHGEEPVQAAVHAE